MELRVRNWSDGSERLLRLSDLKKSYALAGSLSGGMRQLLAIGCALVHDPPLLFLTNRQQALIPFTGSKIWNLLYDLGHEGKTIFCYDALWTRWNAARKLVLSKVGRLLAKSFARALKSTFALAYSEIDVEPLMPHWCGCEIGPNCWAFPCAAAACAFTHRSRRN